jgi:hypothetical protein
MPIVTGKHAGAVIGSWATKSSAPSSFALTRPSARLHPDGAVDTSFDPGSGTRGEGYVECFAIQPDGKILIGGYFQSVDGWSSTGLARLHPE